MNHIHTLWRVLMEELTNVWILGQFIITPIGSGDLVPFSKVLSVLQLSCGDGHNLVMNGHFR